MSAGGSEAKAPRVRVLVADDHTVYREGVARAIRPRPELELIGEAEDGRAALSAIQADAPDVAVLDVQMPGLSGHEVLNAVKRDGLTTRIVLLSASVDSEIVYARSRPVWLPRSSCASARSVPL